MRRVKSPKGESNKRLISSRSVESCSTGDQFHKSAFCRRISFMILSFVCVTLLSFISALPMPERIEQGEGPLVPRFERVKKVGAKTRRDDCVKCCHTWPCALSQAGWSTCHLRASLTTAPALKKRPKSVAAEVTRRILNANSRLISGSSRRGLQL